MPRHLADVLATTVSMTIEGGAADGGGGGRRDSGDEAIQSILSSALSRQKRAAAGGDHTPLGMGLDLPTATTAAGGGGGRGSLSFNTHHSGDEEDAEGSIAAADRSHSHHVHSVPMVTVLSSGGGGAASASTATTTTLPPSTASSAPIEEEDGGWSAQQQNHLLMLMGQHNFGGGGGGMHSDNNVGGTSVSTTSGTSTNNSTGVDGSRSNNNNNHRQHIMLSTIAGGSSGGGGQLHATMSNAALAASSMLLAHQLGSSSSNNTHLASTSTQFNTILLQIQQMENEEAIRKSQLKFAALSPKREAMLKELEGYEAVLERVQAAKLQRAMDLHLLHETTVLRKLEDADQSHNLRFQPSEFCEDAANRGENSAYARAMAEEARRQRELKEAEAWLLHPERMREPRMLAKKYYEKLEDAIAEEKEAARQRAIQRILAVEQQQQQLLLRQQQQQEQQQQRLAAGNSKQSPKKRGGGGKRAAAAGEEASPQSRYDRIRSGGSQRTGAGAGGGVPLADTSFSSRRPSTSTSALLLNTSATGKRLDGYHTTSTTSGGRKQKRADAAGGNASAATTVASEDEHEQQQKRRRSKPRQREADPDADDGCAAAANDPSSSSSSPSHCSDSSSSSSGMDEFHFEGEDDDMSGSGGDDDADAATDSTNTKKKGQQQRERTKSEEIEDEWFRGLRRSASARGFSRPSSSVRSTGIIGATTGNTNATNGGGELQPQTTAQQAATRRVAMPKRLSIGGLRSISLRPAAAGEAADEGGGGRDASHSQQHEQEEGHANTPTSPFNNMTSRDITDQLPLLAKVVLSEDGKVPLDAVTTTVTTVGPDGELITTTTTTPVARSSADRNSLKRPPQFARSLRDVRRDVINVHAFNPDRHRRPQTTDGPLPKRSVRVNTIESQAAFLRRPASAMELVRHYRQRLSELETNPIMMGTDPQGRRLLRDRMGAAALLQQQQHEEEGGGDGANRPLTAPTMMGGGPSSPSSPSLHTLVDLEREVSLYDRAAKLNLRAVGLEDQWWRFHKQLEAQSKVHPLPLEPQPEETKESIAASTKDRLDYTTIRAYQRAHTPHFKLKTREQLEAMEPLPEPQSMKDHRKRIRIAQRLHERAQQDAIGTFLASEGAAARALVEDYQYERIAIAREERRELYGVQQRVRRRERALAKEERRQARLASLSSSAAVGGSAAQKSDAHMASPRGADVVIPLSTLNSGLSSPRPDAAAQEEPTGAPAAAANNSTNSMNTSSLPHMNDPDVAAAVSIRGALLAIVDAMTTSCSSQHEELTQMKKSSASGAEIGGAQSEEITTPTQHQTEPTRTSVTQPVDAADSVDVIAKKDAPQAEVDGAAATVTGEAPAASDEGSAGPEVGEAGAGSSAPPLPTVPSVSPPSSSDTDDDEGFEELAEDDPMLSDAAIIQSLYVPMDGLFTLTSAVHASADADGNAAAGPVETDGMPRPSTAHTSVRSPLLPPEEGDDDDDDEETDMRTLIDHILFGDMPTMKALTRMVSVEERVAALAPTNTMARANRSLSPAAMKDGSDHDHGEEEANQLIIEDEDAQGAAYARRSRDPSPSSPDAVIASGGCSPSPAQQRQRPATVASPMTGLISESLRPATTPASHHLTLRDLRLRSAATPPPKLAQLMPFVEDTGGALSSKAADLLKHLDVRGRCARTIQRFAHRYILNPIKHTEAMLAAEERRQYLELMGPERNDDDANDDDDGVVVGGGGGSLLVGGGEDDIFNVAVKPSLRHLQEQQQRASASAGAGGGRQQRFNPSASGSRRPPSSVANGSMSVSISGGRPPLSSALNSSRGGRPPQPSSVLSPQQQQQQRAAPHHLAPLSPMSAQQLREAAGLPPQTTPAKVRQQQRGGGGGADAFDNSDNEFTAESFCDISGEEATVDPGVRAFLSSAGALRPIRGRVGVGGGNSARGGGMNSISTPKNASLADYAHAQRQSISAGDGSNSRPPTAQSLAVGYSPRAMAEKSSLAALPHGRRPPTGQRLKWNEESMSNSINMSGNTQ